MLSMTKLPHRMLCVATRTLRRLCGEISLPWKRNRIMRDIDAEMPENEATCVARRSQHYFRALQASKWLALSKSGDLAHRASLAKWLKRSPENAKELLALIAVDHVLEELGRSKESDSRSLETKK